MRAHTQNYVKCPHNKCWEGKQDPSSMLKGYSPWKPENSVNLTILKTTETMLNLPTATVCLSSEDLGAGGQPWTHLGIQSHGCMKSVCTTLAAPVTGWQVPAEDPGMLSWVFTASRWDVQFFSLSIVWISGLDGYVCILAKAQSVSFAAVVTVHTFVQALNLLYKTVPTDFVHLEMIHAKHSAAHLLPWLLGGRDRGILSSRPVWDRMKPITRDWVGEGPTRHLQS